MNVLTGREKTHREAMLKVLGYDELVKTASQRLGEALEVKGNWNVVLRAVSLVNDVAIPREPHGNRQSTGQALVVVVPAWMGEIAPNAYKRLQAASGNAQRENAAGEHDADGHG